jgi:hypothetical protein
VNVPDVIFVEQVDTTLQCRHDASFTHSVESNQAAKHVMPSNEGIYSMDSVVDFMKRGFCMHGIRIFSLLLAGSLTLPIFAAVVYDETVSGDLSSSGLAPTLIALSEGSNQILGTQGGEAASVRDYVTFTVPEGLLLSSITVLDTSLGNRGFLGIQAGTQLTLPPSTMTAAGLLGWHHYTPADINVDILPLIGTPANGSTGFTPPLSAGNYTLWIQDSSPGLFSYGFDLELQPVPEPATWMTSLAAFAGVALLRLRRRSPDAATRRT